MRNILKKVSIQELLFPVGITIIAYIIGGVLHDVIVGFETVRGAEDITVFPLATLLGIIGYFAFTLLAGSVSMTQDFDMIVGLGGTRKEFFAKRLIEIVIANAICVATILILAYLERIKFMHFWTQYELEFDILPYLSMKNMSIAILMTTGLVFIISSIILKFGKTGFWVLWVLYMIVCLSMTRIHDLARVLQLDKLAKSLASNGGILGLAIIVVSGMLIFISWLMVRRQAVRV